MKKIFLASLLSVVIMCGGVASATTTGEGVTINQYLQYAQDTDRSVEDRKFFYNEVITMAKFALGNLDGGAVASSCSGFSYNLWLGKSDATTNGEVTKLQKCLIELGYLTTVPTGYYGKTTEYAVFDMQTNFLGFDFVKLNSGFGAKTREALVKEYKNISSKPATLPKTCKQAPVEKGGNAKPVITSLSTYSVPVGSQIEVRGCNFYGFESDRIIKVTNSSGVEGNITIGNPNGPFRITIPQRLCTVDTSYSGLPCPNYMTITPGKYKIYAVSWGGKSNIVDIEVK